MKKRILRFGPAGLLVIGFGLGCSNLDTQTPSVGPLGLPESHPCLEYRANAMLVEDEHIWLGCGEGTTGFGLLGWDGRSWQVSTEPTDYFGTFRVTSIQRAEDGFLYVAGTQSPGSDMVVRVDTSSEPFQVESVLERGSTVGTSFSVGTFRRTPGGFEVAASLTGHDILYRTAGESEFSVAQDVFSSGRSHQILDLELDGEDLYGVGSTISEPHVVMLPTQDATGLKFDVVELRTVGTLWDLSVEGGNVLAAGVEETQDFGAIWTHQGSPSNLESWRLFDVRDLVGDSRATRFYGTCRAGDIMVAVGDYSQLGDGLAVRSRDAGQTWKDISPSDSPILGECKVFADGSVLLVGGEGFIELVD